MSLDPDYEKWASHFWDFSRTALENTTNQLAGILWERDGYPPTDPSHNRHRAERLMFEGYGLSKPRALNEIIGIWQSLPRNGHGK